MGANTIDENKQRFGDELGSELWLFGYGSLIFKADFEYLEKQAATIRGWERRFWQGSHDHRGTEQNPGRVVTLIETPDSTCLGMAYRISQDVLDHLDYREKNGYLRFITELEFDDGSITNGLVYIAGPENDAYLGEDSDINIANQIAYSQGPSGKNQDYLTDLADSIRALGGNDPHVFEIERKVLAIQNQGSL